MKLKFRGDDGAQWDRDLSILFFLFFPFYFFLFCVLSVLFFLSSAHLACLFFSIFFPLFLFFLHRVFSDSCFYPLLPLCVFSFSHQQTLVLLWVVNFKKYIYYIYTPLVVTLHYCWWCNNSLIMMATDILFVHLLPVCLFETQKYSLCSVKLHNYDIIKII